MTLYRYCISSEKIEKRFLDLKIIARKFKHTIHLLLILACVSCFACFACFDGDRCVTIVRASTANDNPVARFTLLKNCNPHSIVHIVSYCRVKRIGPRKRNMQAVEQCPCPQLIRVHTHARTMCLYHRNHRLPTITDVLWETRNTSH